MNFLFTSLFGKGRASLPDSKESLLQKLPSIAAKSSANFFAFVENRGWTWNVFANTESNDEFLSLISELWSCFQAVSLDENPATAWKSMIQEKLQTPEGYSGVQEWLYSVTGKLPNWEKFKDHINQSTIIDIELMEDLNCLEDISDVIKDLIKTMKVLMTFEAVNDIQDDLHVPYFNIMPALQQKQRDRIRRYIGRI